jgi:hypothetical protein
MGQRELSKLVKACQTSLETAHCATRKTIMLVSLATRFPDDVERQTAVQLQCNNENEAREYCRKRRRDLVKYIASNANKHP